MTLLATTVLSAGSPSSNDVEPGVLGFLVVLFIGIALIFLLRSMNKQIRKLPPPEDADAGKETGDVTEDDAEDAKRG